MKYISFSRNFGKEEAPCMPGMEASVGEYVVIMDVDLQDPSLASSADAAGHPSGGI